MKLEPPPPHTARLPDPRDDDADLVWREGLRQVVGGAPPERLDGGADARVGGHDDDGERRILGQKSWQEVEPALRAEAQVDERQVAGALREGGDRGVGA
jgi:hypothetical protein